MQALAFFLPLAASWLAVPLAIGIAARTDCQDRPVGYKAHARPTPYLGGAAVLSGVLLGVLAYGQEGLRLAPIAAGALVLCVVGTLDDRRTVAPVLRVGVEVAAAVLLWAFGLGWSIFAGELANLALTVLWVVGVVNAFNLMDNMDGAAATVASVCAAGSAVLATLSGDSSMAVLALGVCGASLGFLVHNLPSPARIFLGDGGSMPIGYVLAAVIMALPSIQGAGWPGLLAGVMLVGLPVLDTTLVVVSRLRRRVPLYVGARDHLTHRLRRRLHSTGMVAVTLAASQAALCALGLLVFRLQGAAAVVAAALCVLAWVAAVAMLERSAWAPARRDPLT